MLSAFHLSGNAASLPVALDRLVGDSDVIVIGKVSRIAPLGIADRFGMSYAEASVNPTEFLKGGHKNRRTIQVRFLPKLSVEPELQAGQSYVLFLVRSEEFFVVGNGDRGALRLEKGQVKTKGATTEASLSTAELVSRIRSLVQEARRSTSK